MSQPLTPIEFFFVAPNGAPVANTPVSIQLAKAGYDIDVPGVVMPREILVNTDERGRVTVGLQPSETEYYVTVEDNESLAELSYKFYVPAVDDANDVVRLQDIIVDGSMGNISYDEAALLVIQESKAIVLLHRRAAEDAAGESQEAQQESEAARDMALRTLPITSPTPPLNPLPNQEWIQTETLHRYTWLVDSGVGVWAEIGPVLVVTAGETTPTTPTEPTDPGEPFNPADLEMMTQLSETTTSFIVEDGGTGFRLPLSVLGTKATDLPIASSLNRNDVIVITQDGVDKRVSLALLASAINQINSL